MFEYADDARKVKIRIGHYVAHHVVQERPFSKAVRSAEQINAMDRYELAKVFLESDEKKYFFSEVGEGYDPEHLLDDVARYIDQRIPKAYATWTTIGQEGMPDWSAETLGIAYHFPEHSKLEDEIKREADALKDAWKQETTATERQIKYLKSLLKNSGFALTVAFNELTVEGASQLIDHFVNDTPLPDNLFKLLEYDIQL